MMIVTSPSQIMWYLEIHAALREKNSPYLNGMKTK